MADNIGIPIRVLILEDVDDDKELVLRQLKNGGYNPEYICVETQEGLINALDKQSWDIILCDYSMPKFDGLSALRIVKEKGIDIPFILLSGTVGEDVAVEAMKAGAQDYMMKDNLIRLIPVLKRELAEAKIRKEKKLADEEIRHQNAVLDAIINNSHSILIFMLDNKYSYLGFNENHRKEMKEVYHADIQVGMNMLDLITISEVKEKAKASIDKVLSGESFIEREVQPKLNIYYEFHWNAVREDNKVIGVSCFIVDITKRKQSEIALKESTQFNLQIVNSAQEGIVVYDQDLKYVTWNPYMENLTGVPASEVLGKHAVDVFPFLKDSGVIDNIKKALKGEMSTTVDFSFNISSGKKSRWVSDTIATMRNSMGEIIGAISTIQNITERKEAEQKLTRALEKATESDRLKTVFLANMSHELRTPLNPIIGFSDIINKNTSVSDVLQFNKIINDSGKHLLSIVEDLFDVTLIETGEIKIIKKDIELITLFEKVKNIIEIEQNKLGKNNLSLNLIIPDEVENLFLNTDSFKLNQILINLLKNSLKFTHNGHIDFGFKLDLNQNNPVIICYVEDTGIGISKSKYDFIFDVFRQVEDTHTRSYGGTGLGLTISKKLTELLGGKIWLESEEGVGTTFYFTLPYDKNLNKDSEKEKPNNEKTNLNIGVKTILIVEDDEMSYQFLKIILTKSEIETVWVKNGKDAVEYCEKQKDIDLILMDINLPEMNGYEATKKIKLICPDIPVIAQTAHAISGDREKSIAAGCNDYITKPIDKVELLKMIRKYSAK